MEMKFEVTFSSDQDLNVDPEIVKIWLKRSLENLIDQQCELKSFELKHVTEI